MTQQPPPDDLANLNKYAEDLRTFYFLRSRPEAERLQDSLLERIGALIRECQVALANWGSVTMDDNLKTILQIAAADAAPGTPLRDAMTKAARWVVARKNVMIPVLEPEEKTGE